MRFLHHLTLNCFLEVRTHKYFILVRMPFILYTIAPNDAALSSDNPQRFQTQHCGVTDVFQVLGQSGADNTMISCEDFG